MNRKIITTLSLVAMAFLMNACGGSSTSNEPTSDTTAATSEDTTVKDAASYDPTRGEGKFDSTNVTAGALDAAMATKGKAIAETKCFSCHKTTDEKLVGPGWKDVTKRHSLHWIMNFITNPDPMIDKDPEVQAQLEVCLVRMPNQSLTDTDAREIVEFMRQNDGAK